VRDGTGPYGTHSDSGLRCIPFPLRTMQCDGSWVADKSACGFIVCCISLKPCQTEEELIGNRHARWLVALPGDDEEINFLQLDDITILEI
jgi:hypothetical protein